MPAGEADSPESLASFQGVEEQTNTQSDEKAFTRCTSSGLTMLRSFPSYLAAIKALLSPGTIIQVRGAHGPFIKAARAERLEGGKFLESLGHLRHRHREWLRVLRKIDRETPKPKPSIWTQGARDTLQKFIRAKHRLSSRQNATLH